MRVHVREGHEKRRGETSAHRNPTAPRRVPFSLVLGVGTLCGGRRGTGRLREGEAATGAAVGVMALLWARPQPRAGAGGAGGREALG